MAGGELERRSFGGPRPVRLSGGSELLAGAVRAAVSGFALLRDRLSSDAYIDPGRLRTVRSLGEGAFGCTHQAQLRPADGKGGSGRDVAVKTLHRQLLDDPEQVQLFVKEVELLRKLRHRHIVELVGCSWQRSSLDDSSTRGGVRAIYFVQEYCAGGSLGDLVRRQMIRPYKQLYSDADALRWCLQVAQALQYLHQLDTPVMHRDLKLDNMMLSAADVARADAKLGDFGLARLTLVEEMRKLEDERACHKLLSKQGSSLTDGCSGDSALCSPSDSDSSAVLAALGPGSAVYGTPRRFAAAVEPTGRTGSLGTMAPEVLRSQPYDARCDIFSLGMCMHNVFARTIPSFQILLTGGEEHLEQYAQLVADGYRPPLPPGLPLALGDLIGACWKGEPSLRPSAAEVVAALQALQDSGELGSVRAGHAAGGCCTVM